MKFARLNNSIINLLFLLFLGALSFKQFVIFYNTLSKLF